jgi:putative membrane protein insertion efficiency factor
MKILVFIFIKSPILLYQKIISPVIGCRCRFYPTCSCYAIEAIETHGVLKGIFLSVRRILSCHPWSKLKFHNPVPKQFTWRDIIGYNRIINLKLFEKGKKP